MMFARKHFHNTVPYGATERRAAMVNSRVHFFDCKTSIFSIKGIVLQIAFDDLRYSE